MINRFAYRSLIFFAIAGFAIGCKSVSTEPATEQPASDTPGTFRYTLDGKSFDWKNYNAGQASSNAWLFRAPSGQKTLEIKMQIFDPANSVNQFVGVHFSFRTPLRFPDTSLIANADGAVWTNDSTYYASIGNGTFILTKFDSVNNVVSGSFSFDAILQTADGPPPSVRIASGSFNDIPITVGSYGQGTVSATIDGQPFSTTTASTYEYLSATKVLNSPGIELLAFDQESNGSLTRLHFTIPAPAIREYDLSSGSSSDVTAAIFIPIGASDMVVRSGSGTTGKFTLTKFNTFNHRLSATFDFSGLDTNSGKTIHVTNGVIDNVRWVVQ